MLLEAGTITTTCPHRRKIIRMQPESNNPQLTFSITDSQLENNISIDRIDASTELNAWQTQLLALSATAASATASGTLDAHSKMP